MQERPRELREGASGGQTQCRGRETGCSGAPVCAPAWAQAPSHGPRANTHQLSQGPNLAAEHLLKLEVLRDNHLPRARLFLSFAGGQIRRGPSPEIAKAISRQASQGIIAGCELEPGQVNLGPVSGHIGGGAIGVPCPGPHLGYRQDQKFKGIFSS